MPSSVTCVFWRGAESVVGDKVPYHRYVGQTHAVQIRRVLADCREYTGTLCRCMSVCTLCTEWSRYTT